ncbi:MAG: cobalamin-independent methionine synthase II family protein [Deltaproteobacteria bacterium]|nr:cobalamin-independent methionine synthase II family protein [Deltaproteobacteria bacterium]
MTLPTEPIGSIPRPATLLDGMKAHAAGKLSAEALERLYDDAVADTVRRFEETGSPVITDGEQRKPSFATYPIAGLTDLSPDGVVIPFADGHTRQLPRLTRAPFRYARFAAPDVELAARVARRPLKVAVISASALSLLYPPEGIAGYSREAFLDDLVRDAQEDLRKALAVAHSVQIDFTEGRLSLKLDPTGDLLRSFVELINRVIAPFDADRARLGVHTCPGGDQDSTHSADVDYAALLPTLFSLDVGKFFVQLASEKDRPRVLQILGGLSRPDRRIFVGVIDPLDRRVETAGEVRDRILEAARFIEPSRLGTCDDCGFSPFGDDVSTSRDVAFAKIRARVEGNELASRELGV